jgi:hypothetical protein
MGSRSGSGSFRSERWRRWGNCRSRPRDTPASKSRGSTVPGYNCPACRPDWSVRNLGPEPAERYSAVGRRRRLVPPGNDRLPGAERSAGTRGTTAARTAVVVAATTGGWYTAGVAAVFEPSLRIAGIATSVVRARCGGACGPARALAILEALFAGVVAAVAKGAGGAARRSRWATGVGCVQDTEAPPQSSTGGVKRRKGVALRMAVHDPRSPGAHESPAAAGSRRTASGLHRRRRRGPAAQRRLGTVSRRDSRIGDPVSSRDLRGHTRRGHSFPAILPP